MNIKKIIITTLMLFGVSITSTYGASFNDFDFRENNVNNNNQVMVMHKFAFTIMSLKEEIKKYVILKEKRGERAVILKVAKRTKKKNNKKINNFIYF